VKTLLLDGVRTLAPKAATATIDLTNTEDVFVYNSFPAAGTETFLKLNGDKTKNVVLRNNNFKYVKAPLKKEDAVKEQVVVD